MPTLRRWRQEDRELQPFVLVKDIKGKEGGEQGREGGRERRREGGLFCFNPTVYTNGCHSTWGSDNDWQELVISFYHVGSGV